jgi:hypothetical protein
VLGSKMVPSQSGAEMEGGKKGWRKEGVIERKIL